jgi:hypothetical protein
MIRTLLTTTAVAVLMGTAANAQEAPVPADAPAMTTESPAIAPAAPTAVDATPVEAGGAEDTTIDQPWDISTGYVVADTDNLGTRLIGQPVYSSAGDDAEEIGKINDLVFSADGQIEAVVIGVGGFLGIGEKNVAVDFQGLEFTLAADNTERWVVPTTADALTSAPDFVWEEDEPADANVDAMAPVDGAAPADAMAPAPVTN